MEARISGCLFGGAVVDAVGIPIEFKQNPSEAEIQHAMTIGGGGTHNVGRFQVSDDTELQMALLHALYNNPKETGNIFDSIAYEYSLWIRSFPFDSGATCSRAFLIEPSCENIADKMYRNAQNHNLSSQANGHAMRISPLIIYALHLSDDDLVKIVGLDASLSHPNKVCLETNAIYAIAMKRLLLDETPEKALEDAEQWAKNYACNDVNSWLKIARNTQQVKKLSVYKNMGWIKWAFILTFYHLRKKTSYKDAIYQVIRLGGDSDTSACIVGSVIGALHGIEGIPKEWVDKVRNFDSTKHGGHKRPDKYHPKHLDKYIKWLVDRNIQK